MPENWKLEQPDQVALGEGVRSLRLFALAGRVNLIGTDGPATLEVTRVSGQPLYVELSDRGELVVRHGEHAKPQLFQWLLGGKRLEVALTLALPPDALIDVKVLSGPVVVSNFHERVTVKGVSGEITLAGVHGAARVGTVSGAVTAEQVTGDLTVKAVSGAITVIAGAGGSIDLSAVSGAIAVDLEDPVPSTAKLQCVSGAMTVRLPHDPDVRVDLGTANGRAVSAFPEVRASGQRGSQKLAGTIGAGTATLVGKTVSGSVTLLRRSADEEPWDLVIDEETAPKQTAQNEVPQDEVPHGQAAEDQTPGNGENSENSEDAR
jgi:Putative adhesin